MAGDGRVRAQARGRARSGSQYGCRARLTSRRDARSWWQRRRWYAKDEVVARGLRSDMASEASEHAGAGLLGEWAVFLLLGHNLRVHM